MFGKPSLLTRITVAKTVGLLIGPCRFFRAPRLWPRRYETAAWRLVLVCHVSAPLSAWPVFSPFIRF